MLTLLWGLLRDSPLAAVHRELLRLGVPVHVLHQRDVLDTQVELDVGAQARGCVRVGDRTVDLADVGAGYLRPHESTKVASVRAEPPSSAAHQHALAVDAALLCWADLTPAYVVNRPAASASNGSKPYQLRRIADVGFDVPETLVTNNPEQVREFVDRNGSVVYKSVSSIRSRVRALTGTATGRLPDVLTCPTQFQRRVPGTDVRVHVVGADVFATEVTCAADDYRYAREQGCAPARLSGTELPDDVADRCRRLATGLGLPVAGIDLRRSPDGRWYCFEVNPSPAFSYYEAGTGQRIAASVAALLAAATLCAESRPSLPLERP